MTISDPRRRQLARTAARAATILCAVALGITAWGASFAGVPQASAVPVAGVTYVVTPPGHPSGPNNPHTSGGSATPFTLRMPEGAGCTGDSPNAGYRVQSYMVPSTVDPATLTFDTAGPLPKATGAAFRQPLFDTTGSPYVEAQTAAATPPGGPGPVVNIPTFMLGPPEVFVPGDIPAGTYNVGIACTIGPAVPPSTSSSSTATSAPPPPPHLDRFWNTQMVVSTAAGDAPAGVTWTAEAAPVVTTTTTTTPPSTTSTSSTTTTTTTTPGSTTTSSTSSTTTSSTSITSSTTTTAPRSSTTTTSTTLPTCPATVLTTTTTTPTGSTSTTRPATTTTSSTSTSSTSSTSTTAPTTTSTTAPTTTSTSTTSTTAPPTTTSSTTSSTSTTSTTAAPTAAAARPGAVPLVAAATCLPAGTTVSSTVAAGGVITISSTGWKAGSTVTGVLYSDPVTLGTLTADSTGKIAGSLTVPATVPTGEHELVLTGTDPAGLVRTIRVPVTVTAATAVEGSGSGSGTGSGSGSGGLPVTGSSTAALVAWSVLLLVFGRMAVLLGRPPRVLPPLQ